MLIILKNLLEKKKRRTKNNNFSQNSFINNSERKISVYFYNEEKDEDFNELSYEVVKYKDKRNIFIIFKSIFLEKIDLINIYNSKYQLQFILISQYLTLLMVNIFFNTLLYSNEVISHKYHNNGKLDFIVQLILSLLSNIITSIISYYLNYSNRVDERIEEIKNIKREFYYIFNLVKLIKYLKIKFVIFFIIELFILLSCFYYISIFFIVYSYCKISLIINYITSPLESLITSIVISIIIVIFRKMGLILLNKNIYNTSKYINKNF